MITLPLDWYADEKGNTWLTNGDGDHIVWFDLPNSTRRLEVSITQDNYPGFIVALLEEEKSTDESLARHITLTCEGWYVRKCNIRGVNWDADNQILGQDEVVTD